MLSDWESSLTELSDDEDEYVPVPAKKKVPPRKFKNEYNVTSSLTPYRTTTYTAKSLYDQIIDNTIDLEPEYQRDIVWAETKQSGLIDSILRNFYIPPVVFSVTTHDDGSQTRVCIDGKQRLTSIRLFMDGLIPHKDIVTAKKYWYKRAAEDRNYLVLPKPLMQTFANKQITCIEYDGLADDQEREIFQRVQLGVSLTTAERMQAIPGPWPSLIREVQSIVLGDDGFGEDLDWGHDRGRDFQCLATIICLIDSHPNTSFPTSPRLEKWLSVTTPVPQKVRADVLETFKIFIALVKDKKYNTAFRKPSRVSPVEFTMTGVLIHLFKRTYSLMQLSSAIWQMRADVRKQFSDIRANNKVTKVMLEFMKKGLQGLELASDREGDIPASTAVKQLDVPKIGNAATPTPGPVAKEKRRRREVESSDDSEYEAVSHRRRVSMPQVSSTRATASKAGPSASKATGIRKVSAPAKVVTSKTAGSMKPAKVRTSPAPTPESMSSHSSAPLSGKAPTMRLTTRTTRTAMSAAADLLFPPHGLPTPEVTASGSDRGARATKKSTKSPSAVAGPAPVVKMEVDPPTLDKTHDENAMIIDNTPNTPQVGHHSTSHTTAAAARQAPPINGSRNFAAPPGPLNTAAVEQVPAQHGHNANDASSSAAAPSSIPVPPPPPSIFAPPALGMSASETPAESSVQRLSSSSQGTPMLPPPPPTAPRTHRDRDDDRDRLSGEDWDMDRSRDRDRDRDRGRDCHGYRSPTRDADRYRGGSWEWDRNWDSRKERDWERPPRDWKRRDRSRDGGWDERDRYRRRSPERGWRGR